MASENLHNAESILKNIQEICRDNFQRYTVHAQEQMAIRHITSVEVSEALLSKQTEIIENYPDDKYSPSCLILGQTKAGRILHIQSNHQAIIITTYEPDPEKWINAKTRREI